MSGISAAYLGLFGGSSGGIGATFPTPAYPTYQRLLTTGQQDYQTFLTQPKVQSDLAYRNKTLPTIKAADQLTKDPKLLNLVLTAFNLQSDAQYPARVAAVLNSNLKDQASLANQLLDPRYQQLAKFFNFNVLQGRNLGLQTFAQDLGNKYTQASYEVSLGQQNSALRSASYFEQNISNISNITQILGDTVLRQVVFTALGIPASITSAPIDQQVAFIQTKLDLSSLTGSSGSTTSAQNSSILKNATNDLAALNKLNGVVTDALTPANSIASQAQTLLNGYNNLA